MKLVERIIGDAIARLNSAGLTFGLGSALIVSFIGLIIASAVAYHYVG